MEELRTFDYEDHEYDALTGTISQPDKKCTGNPADSGSLALFKTLESKIKFTFIIVIAMTVILCILCITVITTVVIFKVQVHGIQEEQTNINERILQIRENSVEHLLEEIRNVTAQNYLLLHELKRQRDNNGTQGARNGLAVSGMKGRKGEAGLRGETGHISCEISWTGYENSCYFLSAIRKNWTESQAYCKRLGAYLIEIESQAENIFIKNHIKEKCTGKFTEYWTGGSDMDNESGFIWMNSRNSFNFTDWRCGEPNDKSNEDCVEIPVSSDWNDDNCSKWKNFICEKTE